MGNSKNQTKTIKTKLSCKKDTNCNKLELYNKITELGKNVDPSKYKHLVLGLILLKHISDTYDNLKQNLVNTNKNEEDRDYYIEQNIFWVPKEATWSYIQNNAKLPTIGQIIDSAMSKIEEENETLNGSLPKNYANESIDKIKLGELIDLISKIPLEEKINDNSVCLKKIFEYIKIKFAVSEGKSGGELYTPNSIIKVLVKMIEPYRGRIYDPCCGSGGMFVELITTIQEQGGKINDVSIYGQEVNKNTWHLAKMNLAIRNIDANIKWNTGGSFLDDAHKTLRADFILANPPFNTSNWGSNSLKEDNRWIHGVPPDSNANFAWLQHILYHLSANGVAGTVLANGALSSNKNTEGEIRKAMLEQDIVDCIVSLPNKLFYSGTNPACIWILAKNKNPETNLRNRKGEVLFINAQNLGTAIDRKRIELNLDDITKIANTYHSWLGNNETNLYEDKHGFCKSIKINHIAKNNYILTPANYVETTSQQYNEKRFEENITNLSNKLLLQIKESNQLNSDVINSIRAIGIKLENIYET